ncbi:MAG: nucleotide-binding protein [Promethearchaeota archaeon]
MEQKPLIIAITGKGGTGKTAITSILAKIISESYNYKMLLIDADPTHPHLSNMVKLKPKKTLEQIRIESIKKAHNKKNNAKSLAEKIDFDVYEGLAESKRFCLFSIGQPEGPGCFCPSNTLLRKVIESISRDFDIVLIDCEAGLEQINRMVIKKVDYIIIITDVSLRSVETAASIKKNARKFTNYKKIGAIINKARGNIDPILIKLKSLEIPLLGIVPEDKEIIEMDLNGSPLIDISKNSISYKTLEKIAKKLFES